MTVAAPHNGRNILCRARHLQCQLVHERYFVIRCRSCSSRAGYGVFHVYDTAKHWTQLSEEDAGRIVQEGAR